MYQGEYHVVTFVSPLTEDEILLNEEILAQNANPAIPLSALQERAEHARMEAVERYLPLLIADEPTGALDSKTAAEIMEVFKTLHQQGKTVIIVTHDMGVAAQCDRVIEIADGEIV